MLSFPVVKPDPFSDDIIGLLERFEVVVPDALLFDGSKEPFDHAVLLRSIRRDEFMFEVIVFDCLGERFAGKYQAVIAAKSD